MRYPTSRAAMPLDKVDPELGRFMESLRDATRRLHELREATRKQQYQCDKLNGILTNQTEWLCDASNFTADIADYNSDMDDDSIPAEYHCSLGAQTVTN